MRIAVVEKWFSEKMGYAENCLSKALAMLGHDVHVVTSDAQVYLDQPFYGEVYEPYLGPGLLETGTKATDGYQLHRLPHELGPDGPRIRGLLLELRALRPDVVQTFSATAPATREAAWGRLLFGYHLFTGNHVVRSVLPEAQAGHMLNWKGQALWSTRYRIPGRLVSLMSERCYAVTPDAAAIAVDFYGVQPGKVVVSPLGVDTDWFYPPDHEPAACERAEFRRRAGFEEDDIVCIYTGRFTEVKNPGCLADAVSALRAQGEQFRALFVGDGPQADVLRAAPGCTVLPFAPFPGQATYYRGADIGVWPMEESTSMLDAAACGLPIVANERLRALEHLGKAWVPYRGGDVRDLVRALLSLRDPARRRTLGALGVAKIAAEYSWMEIARCRTADYDAALRGRLR